MKERKSYALRILISIDQLFNVLLFNGDEDHTISGMVGYKAFTTKKRRWLIAESIINTIFWLDKNHCYNSIEWDEI